MILLDTHVVLHYARGDKKVGKRALTVIDRARERDELFVSALSFWEVTMLIAKDRVVLDTPPAGFRAAMLHHGIQEIAVDGVIAIAAGELPPTHGDPADRLIVATAMVRGLTLVTADDILLAWRMRGYRVQDAAA
jgi:PIN domain nuclease of toxin-antitoxin system